MGVDGTTGASFGNAEGWYRTGDIGFVADGLLYVCGRADDYLVANGRNIYAPAIETAVGGLESVRAGRVAAVGLPNGDWAIVAESTLASAPGCGDLRLTRSQIRASAVSIAASVPAEVLVLPSGALPLTPSGKLRRNDVRARLLRGEWVSA